MPFAIMCEQRNKYTDCFDDVVIIKSVYRSFLDKFSLLKYSPYDETIFLDADILAYKDLNEYWDFFKEATDFSTVGKNVGLYDEGAWYDIEDVWKYGKKIQYKAHIWEYVILEKVIS